MKRTLSIVLLLLSIISIPSYAEDNDGLKVGQVAPEFTLSAINNREFSLSDFKGKFVVLDFWASWCRDCVKDVPEMKEIVEKYSSDKIIFAGVSLDTDKTRLESFIKEKGIDWLQLTDLKGWKSPVSKAYSLNWIPTVVIINPEGNIVLVSKTLQPVIEYLTTL